MRPRAGLKPEELLSRGLNQLKRASLKPQQRMFMLINNLLPKLYHRLVLSRIHGGVLRRMDKLIRETLKTGLSYHMTARTPLFILM